MERWAIDSRAGKVDDIAAVLPETAVVLLLGALAMIACVQAREEVDEEDENEAPVLLLGCPSIDALAADRTARPQDHCPEHTCSVAYRNFPPLGRDFAASASHTEVDSAATLTKALMYDLVVASHCFH